MANLGYSFLLVLTAFLWGSTFVAQVEGNSVGPFTFVCIRNFIATAVLFGLAKILDKLGKSPRRPKNSAEKKLLWKAGFLTTCYIIFVPILSLFLGKKSSFKIWFCVLLTLCGLYLLCIKEDFSIQLSDSILLLCAIAFAVQILVVDKYVTRVDNVRLSAIQFLVVAILSIFPTFFIDLKSSVSELHTIVNVYSHGTPWIPLLYAAILSSGVAFTLQIIAQNKLKPTVASLLMSLESVFAVLSGWVYLGERLSLQEGIGCILMFAAVILSQIEWKPQK